MKKFISVFLAVLMVFLMGISAFATDLLVLGDVSVCYDNKVHINVVDAFSSQIFLYASDYGTYFIALEDKPFQNIKVSSSGAVSAELIEFDPETMVVYGMDIEYGVSYDGEIIEYGLDYETAVKWARDLNKEFITSKYEVVLLTNVNIIRITIADNYGTSYTEGIIKVEAFLNGTPYAAIMHCILDVTIFEYEQVKAAAQYYDDGAALICGYCGYSDYFTSIYGYGPEYVPEELRTAEDAAVISTTAFRAIEGQNIAVSCENICVEILEVAPGQKGVNFKHYYYSEDRNWDGKIESINFGFYGNQVIKSDFWVTYVPGLSWYQLREAFGIKLEEDDIITYYIIKDGLVVKTYCVDYSIADVDAPVVFAYYGSNCEIGQYKIAIEVPPCYSVEFNANGGEAAPRGQSKAEGRDIKISEDVPTRKWHTFMGWATSPDATEPEYMPGDIYAANADLTLYAVWQEDVPAMAELTVSSGTISVGNVINVSVDISSEKEVSVIQFALKYDPTLFEVVSCTEDITSEATINYEEDGMIYFVWEDNANFFKDGTLLNIEFKAKEDAQPSDTVIEIVEAVSEYELILADTEFNEFRANVKNGDIRIIGMLLGDVTCDGKINVIDANYIRRYSAKMVEMNDAQKLAADVNGDGKINIIDANLIRKYVAKVIDTFPAAQ